MDFRGGVTFVGVIVGHIVVRFDFIFVLDPKRVKWGTVDESRRVSAVEQPAS